MKFKIVYLFNSLAFAFCIFSFNINSKIKNNGYYKLASYPANPGSNDSTIVSGNIFDLKTHEALPSSSMTLKDLKIGSIVDDCGHFVKKIKAGSYTFVFNNVGNTELTTKAIVIKSNHKYHFIIYLDSYSINDKSK